MTDNKNMELNDEMMSDAAGGEFGLKGTIFHVGDRVSWDNNHGWSFGTIVKIDKDGFCHYVLVDPGYPSEGETIVKHARNLHPVDM
jgi:hypothetical protein